MPDQNRNAYDPDPAVSMLTSPRMVEAIKATIRTHVSAQAAESLTVSARRDDTGWIADNVAMDLTTAILAERLPPHVIRQRVQYEHPEAIGRRGVAADARFARPIDHFTAKYRGRWWGRLLRLHRRRIEYTFVPVPFIATMPVRCNHEVAVEVRQSWTYPRSNTVLPGDRFGHPVLHAGETFGTAAPVDWRDEFADMVKLHARQRGDRW